MGPDRDPAVTASDEDFKAQKCDTGSLHGLSDGELVSIVLQGDESAFELIFERHKRRVTAIAGRFFQEHVEDILQESFARAYFALPEFLDRGEGSFAAWLSKIAFNTCYDELRRRGRRRESLVSDLSEVEAQMIRRLSPESASIESSTVSRDLANRLLAHLSPEDRVVLVLLDIEGLSVREIAAMMGWSVAKVKIRAFRARSHLRGILAKFL
jgi:RNA polymerase sigma-70 factor (ECF subfamily)